ncbi:MAG: Ig domain-containing protein [Spirochaetaceae bacterium]|nr:Ig domain-containing protein [Spirochaetaceae bacterium]
MRNTNRLIVTATALVAIGAVLAGCTSPVTPDVRFSAEKLTISLPAMVVGQAFPPTTLPEAMGGKEGLVYSLSPDVPGLTFDRATRVLSGTPLTPGTYDMNYTAKDSATGGTMESVTFAIVVNPRPLTNRERILGTWQKTHEWWDDAPVGTFVDYLTFTETRFILVRSHFLMDGSFDHSWHHRGTWDINDEEVIRIWYHDHDERDDTDDILTELRKPYLLIGDDDLLINHWTDESGEDSNSDWMTRVTDPSLSLPPQSVWVREWYRDDGWYDIDTMTLAADGTFTWSEQDPSGTWTLTAQWELDLDNYFINLTNATETWTETGEDPVPDGRTREARFLRFAYAPMMSESGELMISVSYWDDELEDPHGKYGSYSRVMTRQ